MLCRPCHGEFVDLTIRQAIAQGAREVVYVGLARNVDGDLDEYRSKFREVLSDAGESGESVWRMTMGRPEKRQAVALIKIPCWQRPTWMRDAGEWWRNMGGGGFPKSASDEVIARAEIVDGDWQALDWTMTDYGRNQGDAGWLDRDGNMTRCQSTEHDDVAYLILKKDVSELEAAGYVRVDGRGQKGKCAYRMDRDGKFTVSPAQRAWLLANGHELYPMDMEDEAAE